MTAPGRPPHPRGPATSRSAPRKLLALAREARAVELRSKKRTLQQIADELGITKQGVQKVLDRAMAHDIDKISHEVGTLRARQLAEALELRGALFDIINAGGEAADVVAAVKALVGVQQHEAKLVGAFAPERRELSGPGGGPLQTESKVAAVDLRHLTDDELRMAEALALKIEAARAERAAAGDESTPPAEGPDDAEGAE